MKNKNGIYIIGVDHGYGNIKTANCCFPTGVESSDMEPTFKNDLLIYQGRYYQIGVGHKEYAAEKVMDEDYYILTLAAIARELSKEQITQANVFLAAGLPLSWVAKQRKAFQAYLLQNREVEFSFRRKDYHIRIVGAAVYPQGFAAIAPIVNHFTGSNMLCDIGNGTMNILRTLDSNVDLRQMFTEKYGVQQCVLAIQEMDRLAFTIEHSHNTEDVFVDTVLLLLILVIEVVLQTTDVILLSPDLRAATKDLESYRADYRFLQENGIRTITQLEIAIPEIQSQIDNLETERSKADNTRRRARTPEAQQEAKDRKKELTQKIAPLRKKLRQAKVKVFLKIFSIS